MKTNVITMKSRVIWTLVGLAASAVAVWQVGVRGGRLPSRPASGTIVEPGVRAEGIALVDRQLKTVLEPMLDQLSSEGVITRPQAESLGAELRERVRFTLLPEYSEWQRLSERFGAKLPSAHPFESARAFTAQDFATQSRELSEARFDFAAAQVRPLVVDGQPRRYPEHTGSFARAGMTLAYPKPPSPPVGRSTIFELIVPAVLRPKSDNPRSVHVSFEFWWQSGEGGGRWVPYQLTIHFEPGEPLKMGVPVF